MKRTVKLSHSTVSYQIYIPDDTREDTLPPLVFLHGTNSDGESSFGRIHPEFSLNRKVIIPDYAGCGDSTLPCDGISIETLVDQVVAILESCEVDKVDLVGHSLGAVVAAALAGSYPAYVNRLILSAPWCDSGDPRHQLMFRTWKALEESDTQLSTSFGLSHVLSPGFLSGMGEEMIEKICKRESPPNTPIRIELGLNVDIRHYLEKIHARTLVIGMAYDTLIPLHMVQVVASRIKDCEYCEVGSGHAVQLENPSDWSREISGFFNRHITA
ncbi:alpha/beta fold hydrolase [Photobacterium sp. 1_MG-2023]|uniref:alpha/beta fold hydrolase n=1 Tax=Photobacterium sp. 1_MG-2023 TaxID=3062646 RepID=UPI0026E2CE5C|nr:alpha/beta hydrolase [Photobacterium sp. 1_MG-2023]MDO6704923.1 alpha/beta hydrolase [Photobacterium sp. 1_MG-2023]